MEGQEINLKISAEILPNHNRILNFPSLINYTMNWKEWATWKEKKYLAVALFVVAYALTIPLRNYRFLEGIVDISQGVPIWAHLMIIVAGSIVLVGGLWVIEVIVKKFAS